MKQRIITAIVLLIVILPCVIIGNLPFTIFMLLISIGAAYELLHITVHPKAGFYLYFLLAFFIVGGVFLSQSYLLESLYIMIYLMILLTCGLFDEKMPMLRMSYYFLAAVLVASGLHTVYYLRIHMGLSYILFLALATLGADTGAYFVGRAIGKHKLNPRLSPNKTIEGSIGGTVFGALFASMYAISMHMELPAYFIILCAVILATTGQIGDLTFSSIKRTFEVKDYSNLFPGHGGVLDRFDSIIFNAMVFGMLLNFYTVYLL